MPRLDPLVLALIGAGVVFLIVIGLAHWQPDAIDDDEEETDRSAQQIIEARYEAEEATAAAAGDLPHLEDPQEAAYDAALLPYAGEGDPLVANDTTPVDESRARVDPDAGEVVGFPDPVPVPHVVGHQPVEADLEAAYAEAEAEGPVLGAHRARRARKPAAARGLTDPARRA